LTKNAVTAFLLCRAVLLMISGLQFSNILGCACCNHLLQIPTRDTTAAVPSLNGLWGMR